jgi:hypothetical protein
MEYQHHRALSFSTAVNSFHPRNLRHQTPRNDQGGATKLPKEPEILIQLSTDRSYHAI